MHGIVDKSDLFPVLDRKDRVRLVCSLHAFPELGLTRLHLSRGNYGLNYSKSNPQSQLKKTDY
jgi:hypothetical protein